MPKVYHNDNIVFSGDCAWTSPQHGQGVNLAFVESGYLSEGSNDRRNNVTKSKQQYDSKLDWRWRFYQMNYLFSDARVSVKRSKTIDALKDLLMNLCFYNANQNIAQWYSVGVYPRTWLYGFSLLIWLVLKYDLIHLVCLVYSYIFKPRITPRQRIME